MADTLEKTIANNIIDLRKSKKMTQMELAEKIHYSDKSVSKWERGDSIPDVKTLCLLAELFEVTLDYFVTENASQKAEEFSAPKERRGYHTVISLMASAAVWGLIIILYVYALIYLKRNNWFLFVWGVPANALTQLILSYKWKIHKLDLPLNSILCWGLLAAVYISFLRFNIWPIFLIGVPVQVILVLWDVLRRRY